MINVGNASIKGRKLFVCVQTYAKHAGPHDHGNVGPLEPAWR